MQSFSVRYVILFSLAICGVCAIFVSALAVSLADEQAVNKVLYRKQNVLLAAGLLQADEEISAEEVEERFSRFEPMVIEIPAGEELPDVDTATFDQRKLKNDPEMSHPAPQNKARVSRIPNRALVYKAFDESGALEMVVLPVEGYGLWSTLYGFLALGSDLDTIQGLAFYEHGETPGLGGEVDNPRWRKLWVGRKAFDGDTGDVAIQVIKGNAGPVEEDPHRVDGLSGATITARGVSNMMQLWLGEEGFGPYLDHLENQASNGPASKPATSQTNEKSENDTQKEAA